MDAKDEISIRWTDSETRCLISVWGDAEIQNKFDGTVRDSDIYKEIRTRLIAKDVFRTLPQIKTKIKNLKKIYRKCKDSMKRGGTDAKTFLYFDQIDKILGNKIDCQPINVLETDIANLSPSNSSSDGEAVRSKWKHLRDHFRKEFKKHQTAVNDGKSEKYDSQWVWYKNLWFLGDQLLSKKLSTSMKPSSTAALGNKPIKEENSEESYQSKEDSDANCSQQDVNGLTEQEMCAYTNELVDVQLEPTESNRKRRRIDCPNNVKPKKNIFSENLEQHYGTDDTFHFLVSLLNPIKCLPYDRQMLLRLKIQNLVTSEVAKLHRHSPYPVELKANRTEHFVPLSPTIILSDASEDEINEITE